MNEGSKARSASSHCSSVAPSNSIPKRLPGYTFNNGNGKQPVLRARECDASQHGDSGVELNFNYWMEHSYLVDRQLSSIITDALSSDQPSEQNTAHDSEGVLKAHSLDAVSNILVVSVQGVDPRELNDSILDLPFLRCTSSMPVRHIREAAPALVSLEDTAGNQAASEQQWQYLDVDVQSALMLWCDKPSVPLAEVAGKSLPELLAKYTLTFAVSISHLVSSRAVPKRAVLRFALCDSISILRKRRLTSSFIFLTYFSLSFRASIRCGKMMW